MTKNPIKLLRDLLPQPPLLVGTVVAINGGVARIQMLGGGTANARGFASINDRVFFRNDVIEALAPALPIELIEV